MLRLTRLTLTNFRSYPALTGRPASRLSVLTGPNGSGKTNLLEAISLLAPGRGLRQARAAEIARSDGGGNWAVAARLDGGGEIGTGLEDGRRRLRIDGEEATQAALAEHFAAVWLTPQMDVLFQ